LDVVVDKLKGSVFVIVEELDRRHRHLRAVIFENILDVLIR